MKILFLLKILIKLAESIWIWNTWKVLAELLMRFELGSNFDWKWGETNRMCSLVIRRSNRLCAEMWYRISIFHRELGAGAHFDGYIEKRRESGVTRFATQANSCMDGSSFSRTSRYLLSSDSYSTSRMLESGRTNKTRESRRKNERRDMG